MGWFLDFLFYPKSLILDVNLPGYVYLKEDDVVSVGGYEILLNQGCKYVSVTPFIAIILSY